MDENIDRRKFFVVDASVILAAIFPQEAHRRDAMAFIDRSMKIAGTFIAPSILLYEVFNAVRSAILSKRLTFGDAHTMLTAYKTIEPAYVDFSFLSKNALTIALKSDCSVYDAAYAALAEERRCPLYTLDRKLIQKLKILSIHVAHLGDFK